MATVELKITNSLASFVSERRFNLNESIDKIKKRLELITGCSSASLDRLELYDKSDTLVATLTDDQATLESFKPENGMRLHVVGSAVGGQGDFEDVSAVEKFELSQKDYEAREDSLRAFKERMKLGKFSDEATKKLSLEEKFAKEKELTSAFKIGMRCEVCLPKQEPRRGTLMYLGETDFKEGWWVGVRYDEPVGKNDGSVGSRRYFTCEPKYGGFVKAANVRVGDFPEVNLDDILDDEI